AKALYTVLSQKLKDGEVIFVDNFDIKEPKTKEAKDIFTALGKVKGFEGMVTKKKNSAFLALGNQDENVIKSFRNFANIKIGEVRNLNILNILNSKYLIISSPDQSIEFLSAKLSTK
ncbi:50S ribosomal protein L4, partial [Patescibacteria group bacterium]|nr:50S ribosomal protein L4 [Patescibacteria group bacterium]